MGLISKSDIEKNTKLYTKNLINIYIMKLIEYINIK